MKAAHGQHSERALCCLWNAPKGRAKQGADFLHIIEASCFFSSFFNDCRKTPSPGAHNCRLSRFEIERVKKTAG